jgi:hypothetical protein
MKSQLREGIQNAPGTYGCEERELLFTRPRLLHSGEMKKTGEDITEEEKLELSSILVTFYPMTRRAMTPGELARSAAAKNGKSTSSFDTTNKNVSSLAKTAAASSSGAILKQAKTSANYTTSSAVIDYNTKLSEIRFRYAPTDLLRRLGMKVPLKDWEKGADAEDDGDGEEEKAEEEENKKRANGDDLQPSVKKVKGEGVDL